MSGAQLPMSHRGNHGQHGGVACRVHSDQLDQFARRAVKTRQDKEEIRYVASSPPSSPANYARCQPLRISINISRRRVDALTSSLNYTTPNDGRRRHDVLTSDPLP